MGIEQNIIVSSAVSPEVRQAILASAIASWPFVRLPIDPFALSDRAVFAPPELTSLELILTAETNRALNLLSLQNSLLAWSQSFPDITFAYIETGWSMLSEGYRGFGFHKGKLIGVPTPSPEKTSQVTTAQMSEGLESLLVHVGIILEGESFEPFATDEYFAFLREDQWDSCPDPERLRRSGRQQGYEVSRRKRILLTLAYLEHVYNRLQDPRKAAVLRWVRAASALDIPIDCEPGELLPELAILREELRKEWLESYSLRNSNTDAKRREDELGYLYHALYCWFSDHGCLDQGSDPATEVAVQANLFREVTCNPFRPPIIDPRWLTSTVLGLLEAIDSDQAYDRLPILADALQDADCNDADILAHCRGTHPHVRGCWVVDVLLQRGD